MSIDASFRRSILPDQDRGNVIPDSQKKKADNPQLVMEPGVVRPVFKFADGLGLTDQFGNVYDGYGGGGGNSIVWNHTPAESVDDEIDNTAEDLDFIQYNGSTEKFETRSYIESQLMQLTNTITPNNEDLAIFDASNQWWKPISKADFIDDFNLVAVATGQTFDPFDIIVVNASGQIVSVPQIFTDFLSVIIKDPENRTYTLVQDLPFDITITGTNSSIETGAASVNFPSGTITAGNPVEVTVSSVDPGSEFLRLQIDYTRNLNIQ